MDDGDEWRKLLRLFRHYFGTEIDKIMISIFLAAASNPGISMSDGLGGDVDRLSGSAVDGESFYENAKFAGFFDID